MGDDLDLTAAIDAGKATHVGYAPDGPTMRLVEASIRAAAPIIERAVREQLLGPANPLAPLGAEVRVTIRHRDQQWGSSQVISDREIEHTASAVDPVRRSLLYAVDEVLGGYADRGQV